MALNSDAHVSRGIIYLRKGMTIRRTCGGISFRCFPILTECRTLAGPDVSLMGFLARVICWRSREFY